MGDEGYSSLVWFHVQLPDNAVNMKYQFLYQSTDGNSGSLSTFYRDNTGTPAPPVRNVMLSPYDDWFVSDCYELPDAFVGEIYIRATRGTSDVGHMAIDNVQVFSGECPCRLCCKSTSGVCFLVQSSISLLQ